MRLPRQSTAKCGARSKLRVEDLDCTFSNGLCRGPSGVGPKGDQVVGCRDYLHSRAHKFNGAEPVHSTLGSATPTLTSKTSKVRRPMMCPVEEGSQSELTLFECTGVVPVGRPSRGHGPPSEGCVSPQQRRLTAQRGLREAKADRAMRRRPTRQFNLI